MVIQGVLFDNLDFLTFQWHLQISKHGNKIVYLLIIHSDGQSALNLYSSKGKSVHG